MKCPNCKKDLDLLPRIYINVETYSPHSAVARADCCGTLIHIEAVISYKVKPYTGTQKEDDWGA